MRDDYLNNIILRGNELNLLEQAASVPFPKNASVIRWAVAAAFGLLVTLLPSVCTAHAFFQMI
ncbi:MAG: hypothetical protein IKS46_01085 [Clostridia bacterium]|nr:hypothetical protein [Clostridia bacterium]